MKKTKLSFLTALLLSMLIVNSEANAAITSLSGLTVDTSDAKSGLLVVIEALVALGVIWMGGSLVVAKVFGRR